ncbi:hypothetical protein ACFSCW_05005 [Sphingomonas tabacisoli]|uniref:Caspase domain-containing protein n=1 Tax=Sphingomonas tabacisoli TaxID=2249466 RepID=A0ABW4I0U0_9SPHN
MPLADRALIVGIDRYSALGALSGAERDAAAFYDWVTTAGGVQPANATKIVSSNFKKAPKSKPWNERPAQQAIDDFFHAVQAASDANNAAGEGPQVGKRLYMFFSGHGFAPALDRSGVLMANASPAAPINVAAMLWANRMYEGGWFDEVLLFQDACRQPMRQADLSPPFLVSLGLSGLEKRRRFIALSAKNDQLSLEKKINGADVRGVFSVTLLDALKGGARDPLTGEITAAQLKSYLQSNMKTLLTSQELADPEIASQPEVFDPDPFVIVGPPPGWAAAVAEEFPVSIGLKGSRDARILDHDLKDRIVQAGAPDPWPVTLPRGLFRVLAPPYSSEVFEVTGALRPNGVKEVTNVAVQ